MRLVCQFNKNNRFNQRESGAKIKVSKPRPVSGQHITARQAITQHKKTPQHCSNRINKKPCCEANQFQPLETPNCSQVRVN